ncbi:DUF1905 domain-containing protein [Leucobacter sp. NPDC058333]|uniref:DUF1905 domain-containing protein n=1 Tax=Leucobacter sp. NPDC058333 TaxID=3346450 RepID=UPI0036510149
MEFAFTSPLARWDKKPALWTFVLLSEEISDAIAATTAGREKGFGSARVQVTVGAAVWTTSIFPSDSAYMLPIKKAVRESEGLELGAPVVGTVQLLDF